MMRRILPSVTTLSAGTVRSGWWDKVAEIERLGLGEVALFVTGLSTGDRLACYAELEKVRDRTRFSIPFVHAVSSMDDGEFEYLVERFGVERFNLHSESEFPLSHSLSEAVRRRIFIENSPASKTLNPEELERFGGICFDLSHLEDSRRYFPEVYEDLVGLSLRFPVGANHISAVPERFGMLADPSCAHGDSKHRATKSREFFYLSQLHYAAFADLCAVELENSLAEQVALIPVIRRQMAQRVHEGDSLAA